QVADPVYRAAFASARYMGYCYMLVLLMFAGDQAMIAPPISLQFSVFYWAGWIFAIVTTMFGYLGFVLPNWFKKLMSYSRKGISGKEMTAESASSE
ncbi:MAG TPA: hypothetical protein VKK79_23795, partial [Candidatus Lokiarchaeia archaeon]|nr:hypothetical protein [Candidatus Lokiarchaeia archaeon]